MLAIFCNAGYSSDLFDETRNVKSFDTASLWASIGGYVGMILGLSLFHIPDIFTGGVDYMQKKTLRQEEQLDSAAQRVVIERRDSSRKESNYLLELEKEEQRNQV